jgi:hypothetical protein
MAIIPNVVSANVGVAIPGFNPDIIPGLMQIEAELGNLFARFLNSVSQNIARIEQHQQPFYDDWLNQMSLQLSLSRDRLETLVNQLAVGFPTTLAGQSIMHGDSCALPNIADPNSPTGDPYCSGDTVPVSVDEAGNATCDIAAKYPCTQGTPTLSPIPEFMPPQSVVPNPIQQSGCHTETSKLPIDFETDFDNRGYDITYRDWSPLITRDTYIADGSGNVVSGWKINPDYSITTPDGKTYQPSQANYQYIFVTNKDDFNKIAEGNFEGSPLWYCNHPGGIPSTTISATPPGPSQPLTQGTTNVGSPQPTTGTQQIGQSQINQSNCGIVCPQPIINIACNPTPINISLQLPTGSQIPIATTPGTIPQTQAIPPEQQGQTQTTAAEWEPPPDDAIENYVNSLGFDKDFTVYLTDKIKARVAGDEAFDEEYPIEEDSEV